MDLVKNIAKDFFKEIDDKSREFFEFVLPQLIYMKKMILS